MPQFLKTHHHRIIEEPVRKGIEQTAFVPHWIARGAVCNHCRWPFDTEDAVMALGLRDGTVEFLHSSCVANVVVDEQE